jgi:hypothetical protein
MCLLGGCTRRIESPLTTCSPLFCRYVALPAPYPNTRQETAHPIRIGSRAYLESGMRGGVIKNVRPPVSITGQIPLSTFKACIRAALFAPINVATLSFSLMSQSNSFDDVEASTTSNLPVQITNSLSLASCLAVILSYFLFRRNNKRIMERTSLVLAVSMAFSDALLHVCRFSP